MITIRPANERGHANHGWLDTHHTFSFGSYSDPRHMGFRDLRVINDDTVAPGQGFGKHGHRDMEILSYVLEGGLEHKDSMGTGLVLRPGDVQRMSAGTGVTHSEFNHSATDALRFLQIWVLPQKGSLPPGYEEKHFSDEKKTGRLCLIASPEGSNGSLRIHQEVQVYASILGPGQALHHELAPGRHGWIQVARGRLHCNGVELGRGDGLAVSEESGLSFEGIEQSEFLIFDLS